MESVALKRAAVIAVVGMLLSFFVYWNLRSVTKEDAKRREEKLARKETPVRPVTPGKMAWTLEEAMDAYSRQRDNAYLQYVMLQLARNEKRTAEVLKEFPEVDRARRRDNRQVDLFDLFSGYHAIQESLQLDVMLGANGAAADDGNFGATPLASLAGPSVKSHPWETLLAGKRPGVSKLSRCVPADFYLAEFRSVSKLLEALDAGHDWTTYFWTQAHLDATDQRTRQRIQTQLLLDDSPGQRPLYDAIVQYVAVTGSDPFLKEGSDVTVLFTFQNADFFHAGIRRSHELIHKQYPQARLQTGRHLGIEYTAVTTPDRIVSVYIADPRPGLHIRSNSLVGLRRVLDAVLGKTPTLGDTLEFQYIRTLMPMRAAEEDGLIYLSDAFVRRLVGPRTKITEARRLIGYNHLRMIAHAAQLYRTQFGKAPATLADLEQAGCTPGKFNAGKLACPFGGVYRLSDDGAFGVSSVLGTASFLTPVCELPTPAASPEEADAYGRFLADYQEYWRRYFDPIAIRLQTSPKRIRVETLVLPLIDNSIYTGLARVVGKQPEPLDALPVPARNLFTLNLRFDREALLQSIGKSARLQQAKAAFAANVVAAPALPIYPGNLPGLAWQDIDKLEPTPLPLDSEEFKKLGLSADKLDAFLERGIGNQIGLHYCDARIMFDVNLSQFLGLVFQAARTTRVGNEANAASLGGMLLAPYAASSLVAPVYLAVPVRDPAVVDDFLDHLDPVLAKAATFRVGDAGGPADLAGDYYRLQNKLGIKVRAFGFRYGPFRFRTYLARIGAGLYLTNQPDVLDELHAAHTQRLATKSPANGPTGHAMMRVRPEHWKLALEGYKLGWAENNREACRRNLSMLSAAARAFSAAPPVSSLAAVEEDRERLVFDYARKMYGVDFKCPDGGRYVLEADGKTCRCSVHGTIEEPTQTTAPGKGSVVERVMRDFADLHATVTVLPEGLRAVVVIERK
jgi:hypothetical protein